MKKHIRAIINLSLAFFLFSTFFVVKTWADEDDNTTGNTDEETVLVEDEKGESDEGSDGFNNDDIVNDDIVNDENDNDKKEESIPGDEAPVEGDNIPAEDDNAQDKDKTTEDDKLPEEDQKEEDIINEDKEKEDAPKDEGNRSLSKSNNDSQLRNGNSGNETGYITFSSDAPFSIKFKRSSYHKDGIIQYSIDTLNWVENTSDTGAISCNENNELFFRGFNNAYITAGESVSSVTLFPTEGHLINCSGNIETLLDSSVVLSGGHPEMDKNCFNSFFYSCKSLASAPELPATKLAEKCYHGMFLACTSLVQAPELPATVLEKDCYSGMFNECKSLNKAPALVSTELADNCYNSMFANTLLTEAPELPASVLFPGCYQSMFSGCKSLTQAPILSATVLAKNCYSGMFNNCSSLETAPELPAVILFEGCYSGMFKGCASLKEAPEIPATTVAKQCCYFMFNNCTNLLTAPSVLPATELAPWCYAEMFRGCSKLTNPPQILATTLADSCCYYMFMNCSKLAEAPALPATTLADSCYYGMFNGCSGVKVAPELPATTLAKDCYHAMFINCGITEAPELPATTLADNCYDSMFQKSGVTKAPETLPAKVLATRCYQSMFSGCTKLENAPELPATELAEGCYASMFSGCTKLENPPWLPAKDLAESCYASMFSDCTKLKLSWDSMGDPVLAKRCYYKMFNGCISIDKIPLIPATIFPDECCASMFSGCTSIKLYEDKTDEHSVEFPFPVGGEGISSANSFDNMFYNTGGSFKGTPELNTTYYTDGKTSVLDPTEYHSGFTLGKDNNSFSHTYRGVFGENGFKFDDDFWWTLVRMQPEGMPDWMTQDLGSYNERRKNFGGVCHGIAILMDLVFYGLYDVNDITDSDASTFFELKSSTDHKLQQYIQYYYYSQHFEGRYNEQVMMKENGAFLTNYMGYPTSIMYDSEGNGVRYDGNNALIEFWNFCNGGVYLMNYTGVGEGGHAVLITGKQYNSEKNQYEIEIYDLNTYEIDPFSNPIGKFGKIIISDDFSNYSFDHISFSDCLISQEPIYITRVETLEKLKNETEYFLADYDATHPKVTMDFTRFEFSLKEQFEMYISDIRKKITFIGGKFSGDLDIIKNNFIPTGDSEEEPVYNNHAYIDIDNYNNIVITPLTDNCDITIFNDNGLYSVEGSNISSATVSFENKDILISGNHFDFISYISGGVYCGNDTVLSSIKGSSNGTVHIYKEGNNYYAENTDSNDINVIKTAAYIGVNTIETEENAGKTLQKVKLNGHDYNESEYLVTFETGSKEVTIPVQYLSLGSKIAKPQISTINGKPITGWFRSGVFQNGNTYWDFETDTIENNVVLYPKLGEPSVHVHDWSISASRSIARVKCIAEDCDYTTGKEYSVSISAPEKEYDGAAVIASVTKDDGIPTEVSVSEILYKGRSNTEYEESSTAPVNSGTYTASATVTVGNESAVISTDYEITSKSINGAVITLDNSEFTYDTTEHIKTVSSVVLNNVALTQDDYTVSGNKQTDAGSHTLTVTGKGNYKDSVTVDWTIKQAESVISVNPTASDIAYGQSLNDSGISGGTTNPAGSFVWVNGDTKPEVSDSGTTPYEVLFTPNDTTNYKTKTTTLTVNVKAQASTVTTTPEAVTNLNYDGSLHDLVSAGEASGGTMKYALGTDAVNAPSESYQDSVPQGKDAKTYYVWYKVEGDGNHGDVKPECITVEIAKISLSDAVVTLDDTDLVYNESEQTKTVASVVLNGTALTTDDYVVSSNKQTNAGNYTLTVTGQGNYKDSVTASWSISPKNMTVSSQGVNEEYDGGYFEIEVTVSDPSSYTIKFGEEKGVYDQDYLMYSDVGSYPVYYQIKADNYNTYEGSETIIINKATASIDEDDKPTVYSNLVYNDDVQDLVSQGYSYDGTVLYSFDDENFFEEIPSGIEAKTYSIYYMVEGDDNHDDSEVYGPIEATIAKLPVTVTADNISGKYGEDIKELTWTVSDNAKDIDLDLSITTTATKTSPVNLEGYPITITIDNTNVDPTIVNGKYVITKNGATVTASSYNGKYDGQPHGITVEVKDDGSDLVEGNEALIYYSTQELTTENYLNDGSTDNINYTAAGTDETIYYYVASSNYDPEPIKGSQKVIIAKGDPDKSIIKGENKPVANNNLVYKEGEDQTLLTDPSSLPEGYTGTLYSTDGGNNWTDSATGNKAGFYQIKVKYTGNPNYEDLEGDTVIVEIRKADGSLASDSQKAKPITGLVYSEQGQAIVTAPEELPEGYTKVQYSIDDGQTWTDSIPKGKGGDYTVKVKYIGDKNHNDFIGNYVVNVTVQNSYYANDTSWVKGSSEGNLIVFKALVQDEQTFGKYLGVKADGGEYYLDNSKNSVAKGSARVTLNPSYLESLSVGKHTLTAYFSDGANSTTSFTIRERTKPSTPDYVIPRTGD